MMCSYFRLLHEFRVAMNATTKKYATIQMSSTYYPGSTTSRVNCIYLHDFMRDGKRGCFYVYSGGVTHRHAAIFFHSRSRMGIEMACEIFGFDPEPVNGTYGSEISEEQTEDDYLISSKSVDSNN